MSFGGRPIRIHNHDQEFLGTLKKKQFSFGNKFQFSGERGNGTLLLEVKSNFLGNTIEWRVDGKLVGVLSRKAQSPYEKYYRQGGFSYSYSIAQEVPTNNVLRQILLAFAIAKQRVEV